MGRIDDKVVGCNEEEILNKSCERLIELCQSQEIESYNGFFKHQDIYKYTWIQPKKGVRSITDGSDHMLAPAKTLFPHKAPHLLDPAMKTIRNVQWYDNIDNLYNDSTYFLKQASSKRQVDGHRWYQYSNTKMLYDLSVGIHKAPAESLGNTHKNKSSLYFLTEEIEDLVKDKKIAYCKWLSSRNQEDRKQYIRARNASKCEIRKKHMEMKCY